MASHGILERAEWFTIRFYYKLAIFKCMHKAYNGRLPSTLTNCIAKKRNLSYSIRARDSLLVPRFNTRFMKDSVAYRGTVLWNMLSSRYTDLADTSLCNLVKKLKTSDLFKAAKFNVLSSINCFRTTGPVRSKSIERLLFYPKVKEISIYKGTWQETHRRSAKFSVAGN